MPFKKKSVHFAASLCKFFHYLLLTKSAVFPRLGGAAVGEVLKSIEATEAEEPGMSVK